MMYAEVRQQIIEIACEQFTGDCRVAQIARAMRGRLPKHEVEKALQRMEADGVLLPSGPRKPRKVHPDWWPSDPADPAKPVQETMHAPVVRQTQPPRSGLRRARLYTIQDAKGILTMDNGNVVAAWIFSHDAHQVAAQLQLPDYDIIERDWWYFRDHAISCTLQPSFPNSDLYIIQRLEDDGECETLIITTKSDTHYLPAFTSPEAAEVAARQVGLVSYRIEPQPFIDVMRVAEGAGLGYRIMEVYHA